MLRTADLDYDLPAELIAPEPVSPRDSARMLVVSRSDPGRLEDRIVRDLPDLLRPGDLLVFNTSRVVAARLTGRRVPAPADGRRRRPASDAPPAGGGRVEGLFLRAPSNTEWVVMLRAGRCRPGDRVELDDAGGSASGVSLELLERSTGDDPGAWRVRVIGAPAPGASGDHGWEEVLSRVGTTPLPPYILRARRQRGQASDEAADRAAYQTVYAGESGSVAAPTAGLHFTPGLLSRLAAAGVERAQVVLHVGPGTFKPVTAEVVEDHEMHAERCSIAPGELERIARARAEGRRVIAVGTTTVRALEAYAREAAGTGRVPASLETRLLIAPGRAPAWVDGLMTNFHLPRSTLMALVASLLAGGVEQLKRAYAHAAAARYRFYSFGDAMLVLP